MTDKNFTGPLYSFFPVDVEGFEFLAELALDLRWAWDHSADEVWEAIDPDLWALTHNPWVVLQTASRDHLERALADVAVRDKIGSLLKETALEATKPAWFQQNYSNNSLKHVAYFSMEFMLSEALPIYSGGLGNVAGDQLKAASDLGVPVIGVGLLYQQGYFRQVIDKDGFQQALYPYNDPGQLPITPVRDEEGEWLRIELPLPGYSVRLRAWQVQVGRVKLYLLDSNDPANYPAHRGLTSQLYGGGPELRLKQEIVLGIGGWRMLRAIGIEPEVCHLNEGHAAFVVLDRAFDFMRANGVSFEVALAVTRAGTLFTTHTPVAAGFDRFEPELIEQYLGHYARSKLGLSASQLLALGRQNSEDESEPFNMAYLAIRGSGAVNGVSQLHGKVSQQIFQPLFPRWPTDDVPVGYVTNGVHMPTWNSRAADKLWAEACPDNRWRDTLEGVEASMRAMPDDEFWRCRAASGRALIEFVRDRFSRDLTAAGAPKEKVEEARNAFDINALTLGFARRFATYKRPTLLLHDPERLIRILTNPQRPVQLVLAGKAHPADQQGQEMIRQWTTFILQRDMHLHVVFLRDYDMLLTRHLVQGVDVWINTPRRPWEACGTSGMKVLGNGGINLSELDGWWAEAYTSELGWAMGDGKEHGDDPAWDSAEAEDLYTLLEQKVIPEFYARDENGIPTAWVARMRESMAQLTPRFSSNRTVREYTERHYLPLSNNYRQRAREGGALGKKLAEWRQSLAQCWSKLRFGDLVELTEGNEQVFEVQVYLDHLEPDWVRVELYAAQAGPDEGVRQEMERVRPLVGADGGYVYSARVRSARPATDFTPRLVPRFPGAAVPLEANLILWQR